MKLSELSAKVEDLAKQVAALVTGSKASTISAEQHAALDAKAEGLAKQCADLKAQLGEAVKADADARAEQDKTIAGLKAQVDALTKDLTDKKALAAHGAAAAAELAAGQTTPPVAAGTDVDPNGKTPEQKLRAEMEATKDPKAKGVLAAKLRAMKGLKFEARLEPAQPAAK